MCVHVNVSKCKCECVHMCICVCECAYMCKGVYTCVDVYMHLLNKHVKSITSITLVAYWIVCDHD